MKALVLSSRRYTVAHDRDYRTSQLSRPMSAAHHAASAYADCPSGAGDARPSDSARDLALDRNRRRLSDDPTVPKHGHPVGHGPVGVVVLLTFMSSRLWIIPGQAAAAPS